MGSDAPRLRLVVDRREGSRSPIGPAPLPAPALEDIQLLAAVRAGDARSAQALYERARPIIERTLRRLLGRSDPEHQDLFQQAMIEIVRTIDCYRGECSLDGWIATLTAHIVFKDLRHRRVERRVISDVLPYEPAAPDHPAHQTVLRATIDRVRGHLAGMEAGRAWAFLLHDVHGYDLREMAQIMGTSAAAAQSRLVRGRKELHQRIAADPELAEHLERTRGEA